MTPKRTGPAPHPRVRSATLGALFVLAASVLWGTTGTAATFAPDVGPLAIGAAAMGIGGVLQALTAVPLLRDARLPLRIHRRTVLLGGGAVAVYPLAFYSSMHLAGVTVGTVVSIGSAPLASAMLERIVDGRRMSLRWLAGAGVAIAGTVLLCMAEATAAAGDDGERQPGAVLAGVLLGLVAGATYALYSWTAHRLMNRGIPARAAMGATLGTGGLLLMPVLALTGAPLLASGTTAAVGIYLALVPMFAGYLFFGWSLARVLPSTATTISLVEPVVAAVLAVVIVGERLLPAGWLGAVLVLAGLWGLLIPIRREFRQYVNLRPIRVLEGVPSPLRAELTDPGVDFVVVRENNEGEYSEIGGRLNRRLPSEMAIQESVFTREGVTRILDYAFDLAGQRRGVLTSATKSNGIIHTMPFWDELVRERAADYPGVPTPTGNLSSQTQTGPAARTRARSPARSPDPVPQPPPTAPPKRPAPAGPH